MREGPLAALFRKTAQDVDDRSGTQERAPAAPGAPESAASEDRAGTPAEEPASPAVGPEVEEEPRIPLPHERLRHAFSADIPENLLERPSVREPLMAEPAQPEPARDVYARVTRDESVPEPSAGGPVLRVVGVGGAGVNAINRMVEAEIEGVEFLAINTDLQSLQQSSAHETLHIGDSITHGLGSGSNPELGRAAAREEYDRIKAMLRGS
ncbi:MAG TPA: cell division protein FtsZ, partial [Solirubrobacteraceae bacterium]|nr:cell division protein FtsZ [Solirubrobacteraceae bacterium]